MFGFILGILEGRKILLLINKYIDDIVVIMVILYGG